MSDTPILDYLGHVIRIQGVGERFECSCGWKGTSREAGWHIGEALAADLQNSLASVPR